MVLHYESSSDSSLSEQSPKPFRPNFKPLFMCKVSELPRRERVVLADIQINKDLAVSEKEVPSVISVAPKCASIARAPSPSEAQVDDDLDEEEEQVASLEFRNDEAEEEELDENSKKPATSPDMKLPTIKKKSMTQWPQLTSLLVLNGPYEHDILRILNGVYECDAHVEVNAQDGNNIKANAWTKFHDHCFGGGEPKQGLVKVFPVISKPTLLKAKILSIWKYAIANFEHVPQEIYQTSLTQFCLYCEACKKEKIAKENASVAMAKLKDDMHSYKVEQNGIPPGAIGVSGAGRAQHSTNLVIGEPAAMAYVNQKTPKRKSASSNH
jgi:hypothetical protein